MPSIHNYGSISHLPITHKGETRPLRDWCIKLNLPYKTAYMRYTRGVRDPEVLLFVPHHKQDSTGAWVYFGTPGDLKKQQRIQTNFAMTNILPEYVADAVKQLAIDMGTSPDEVIKTFVEHGLKKLGKLPDTEQVGTPAQ